MSNPPHRASGTRKPKARPNVTIKPSPSPVSRTSNNDGDILTCTVDASGQIYLNTLRINLGVPHAHSHVLVTTACSEVVIWDRDVLHIRTVTTRPDKTYYGVTTRAPRRPRPAKPSGMS